jgi:hypothetical protein
MNYDKLDKVFSEYIRLKYSDWKGWSECYTCGLKSFWKYLQNGHFIPRASMMTRFNENNARPQCTHCNDFLNGNLEVFRVKLIEDIGLEKVEELERMKFQTAKFSRSEVTEMIEYYRNEIKKLLER